MDPPLIDLIHAKNRAVEADGAFDNLSGAGKPRPPCDVPQNAVMTRILKDNGAVPEVVSSSRELTRLRAELREASDRTERRHPLQDMSLLEAKIEIARRRD